ncbi:DUF1015 domain-containing protein [Tenacibaculum sp.]|nr:DUF1015 domain-containing protein [Tenacibaculum sp.]
MAIVKPFKAVRATRDKVALVSSKPYEIYAPEKLNAKLEFNPYTFLHIINPGYKYHQQDITGEQRFKLVHNRYLEFKENGIFTQDEAPAFYIYKKVTPTDSFCGIIAITSIEDYHNNVIKKHEDTLQKKEVLFENYLNNTGFNAEPVLLTYPDDDDIAVIIEKYTKQRPEYEFSTTNKNSHLLWVVNSLEDVSKISLAFQKIDALYIADGHHRSASSCLFAENLMKQNPNHTGKEDYNYFMSFLLPESHLKISEFNRFVKDLNGLSADEFLIELDAYFRIEKRGQQFYRPTEKNHFSMYLNGEFYSLYLRKSAYEFTDALSKLDAEILYRTILNPILNITDIRNDSRIAYFQTNVDSLLLKTKVDDGTFKVSFGMLPVDINELKEIADSGLQMPPKTTYIKPKLRSALTIYEF